MKRKESVREREGGGRKQVEGRIERRRRKGRKEKGRKLFRMGAMV